MQRGSGLVASVAALLVGAAGPVHAGYVDIGGGWRAEWASSLDDWVDVFSLGVVGDAVFIQKSAEFTQAPVNGVFPAIPIVFRQIDPVAVSNIVIDDEIITNSTGEDWFDFHMIIFDHGDAFFDPVATWDSDGGGPIGWTIEPFTLASFSDDLTELDISGGVVSDGSSWFPGDGLDDGQLWINVNPGDGVNDPLTVFTLKEFPSVPAPSALAVLALGGLGVRRRRR
jgi:MYXO-CTERM domain-containing protein